MGSMGPLIVDELHAYKHTNIVVHVDNIFSRLRCGAFCCVALHYFFFQYDTMQHPDVNNLIGGYSFYFLVEKRMPVCLM